MIMTNAPRNAIEIVNIDLLLLQISHYEYNAAKKIFALFESLNIRTALFKKHSLTDPEHFFYFSRNISHYSNFIVNPNCTHTHAQLNSKP